MSILNATTSRSDPLAIWDAVEAMKLGIWEAERKPPYELRRNKHMYALYGFSGEEQAAAADTIDPSSLVHPDDRGKLDEFKQVLTGQKDSFDSIYRIIRPDGVEVTLLTHAQNHTNADGREFMLGVVTDISETVRVQKQASEREAEKIKLGADLAAEIKQNEFTHRLLRFLSHEVRNPLAGILGNTQMMLNMIGKAYADVATNDSEYCTCACSCGKRQSQTQCVVPQVNGHAESHATNHFETHTKCQINTNGSSVLEVTATATNMNGLKSDLQNTVSNASKPIDDSEPISLKVLEDLLLEVQECGMHQASVINELLDFEKLKGEAPTQSEPVDVDAVIKSVVRMFRQQCQDKGLRLVYELPEQPCYALGDEHSIKRILINLVSNAAKFTQEGSVTIRVKQCEDDVVFSVVDTGTGIPLAFRPQLFDTIGLTTTFQDFLYGSGLGLCICKTLAQSMQSTISFRDNEPHGTVMCLQMKAAPCPPADDANEINHRRMMSDVSEFVYDGTLPKAPSDTPGISRSASDSMLMQTQRVLVAEDNKTIRKVLKHMLQPSCAELVVAADGLEAVELFDSFQPTAVLLDVHMPRLDGRQAAAAIRAKNPHIPIVFLTGETAVSMQETCAEFSPSALLLKPCSKPVLLATCAKLLKQMYAAAHPPPPHAGTPA